MNLEIGDIVEFDEVIGGVKPYGIDYSPSATYNIEDDDGIVTTYEGAELNGQQIFPTFMCVSTNKTLE